MCCTGMAHCYEQHTHYWVTNIAKFTRESFQYALYILPQAAVTYVCMLRHHNAPNDVFPCIAWQLATSSELPSSWAQPMCASSLGITAFTS